MKRSALGSGGGGIVLDRVVSGGRGYMRLVEVSFWTALGQEVEGTRGWWRRRSGPRWVRRSRLREAGGGIILDSVGSGGRGYVRLMEASFWTALGQEVEVT